LNQARGWIQSPGYPQAYPNNARSCYRWVSSDNSCSRFVGF
jgi:hypothetical protein